MITVEDMIAIEKANLDDAAKALENADIRQLVEWLSQKDDNVRYQAFLLLQNRSKQSGDVYPYWDVFQAKLGSDNSYQRSIGLMLIAENARWDTRNKMADCIDEYLDLLNDEKPITVRQCIQSLGKIAEHKQEFDDVIAARLVSFDLDGAKATMRKSILLDILNVLVAIKKAHSSEQLEFFIADALTSDLLDAKAKKQIRSLL